MTPVDRPSLQHYETARRRVLDAAGRPEELRDALREMRVARDLLPRSATPVVGWLEELLPLPAPDQPGPVPAASTDWIWLRLERRDQTARAVSLVAAGVAVVGLLSWLAAALTDALATRGALAVLGVGLLLVGLVPLALAQRLISYGRELSGRELLRGWTGVELLLGLVAAGVGTAGVLSFAGGGDGHQTALLWSAAGMLVVAIGYLVAVGAGLLLAGRPPDREAGAAALREEQLLLRAGGSRGVRVPAHGRLEAVDEQLRLLRGEVGRVAHRQRTVARGWRSAYFWLGMPAAALAVAAAVVGVAATGGAGGGQGWWMAGLALGAAALMALSIALNPGARWESARRSAARCDSLHRELAVMRHLDLPRYADGDDAREAIEYVLTRLDDPAGAPGSESYWTRWRTGQRPAGRTGHSSN